MHKKLYKAKKNWIIGLAAGSVLLLGSVSEVNADTNSNLNSADSQSVSVLSDTNSTDQKWISQKVANNQSGQYNEQNVRYINPKDEVGYNDTPDSVNDNSNDGTEYEYYSKKNRKIFKGSGTDLIDTYGKPEVYAYNGNDKQLALHPQPYKHVTAKNISSIPSVDNGSYHYLNNGASNAIQFNQDSRSLNYANINEISQYLSCQDYLRLKAEFASPSKEYDLRSLFNDTMNSKGKLEPKRIVKPGEYLTTEELNGLYDAAYDNRPKITFDKEVNGIHITSLLQASVNSIDVSWHLNFENGWHGLTFWEDRKDSQYRGGQLGLADILLPESKNFSWKNTVSRYIFQALKFKRYDGVTDLFGTMALDKNGLPVSSLENNQLYKGNTEVVFMQDGVYAILSSVQQGYAPVLVQLPMAFLKPEYQEFYNNTATLPTVIENNEVKNKNKPNATSKDSEIDEVDLEQSDLEYLKSSTLGLGNLYNDITKTIDGYNQGIRLARFDDVRGKSPKPSAKNSKIAHGIALATDMVKLNTSVGLTDFSNNMLHITSDVFNIVNDNIKEIEKSVEKGIESGDLKLGKVADVLSVSTDFTDTYNNFNKMKSSNEEKKIKGSVSKRKTNFESSRSAHISLMSSISKVILDGFKSNPVLSTFIAAGGASVIGLLIWKITNLFSFALPQDWSDNNLLKRFRLRKKSK